MIGEHDEAIKEILCIPSWWHQPWHNIASFSNCVSTKTNSWYINETKKNWCQRKEKRRNLVEYYWYFAFGRIFSIIFVTDIYKDIDRHKKSPAFFVLFCFIICLHDEWKQRIWKEGTTIGWYDSTVRTDIVNFIGFSVNCSNLSCGEGWICLHFLSKLQNLSPTRYQICHFIFALCAYFEKQYRSIAAVDRNRDTKWNLEHFSNL